MLERILNYIYPEVCGICGKLCEQNLCNKCKIKLKQHMNEKIQYYNKDSFFEEFIYLFSYQNFIRTLLISYKFHYKPYLYKTLAKIIVNSKKNCNFLKSYDIIIPVPISKKRMNERGYNQSELIARQLVNDIKQLKLENKCLIKQKDTKPQSALNQKERQENVKQVYFVQNTEKIKGKKIILIDDIYTTGSTVTECSKMLKQAGASKVGVITIAKD